MLSRWKMMAGILGVSLGGLAAAASQCPKWDRSKGRSEESASVKADPKVSPAGAPSTPAPLIPVTPEIPALPAPPSLTPAGSTPPPPSILPATVEPKPTFSQPMASLPSLPEITPAAAKLPDAPAPSGLPALPAAPVVPLTPPPSVAAPVTKSSELLPPPAADTTLPKKPAATPLIPPTTPPSGDLLPPGLPGTPGTTPIPPKPNTPATGPDELVFPKPTKSDPGALPVPAPDVPPMKPATPPVIGVSGTQPTKPENTVPPAPMGTAPIDLDVPPALPVKPMASVPPAPPAQAPAQAIVADSKFRIVLRVGEGEPTFEVKNGDNLMLKVACEKVDIKSPEKGAGPSEITARGKVRFVGFGAEGTCDELKFMAGTGEVSMSGEVKVQVKDKLGRVESELTTGSMKYKIDSSNIGGQLKP